VTKGTHNCRMRKGAKTLLKVDESDYRVWVVRGGHREFKASINSYNVVEDGLSGTKPV